jgi:Fic family protein
MEPLLIAADSRHRPELTDIAFELAQEAAGFRHSLPSGIQPSLADLIRSMNCYYSNLIEGHYTHSIDIERALNDEYSNDPEKRDLQHEAAAHHRLLWIHPFLDGNGRVARLMSHAILLEELDTGGIWSVARGLAINAQTYKMLLAECDQTRRNDLDGRGNLSEEALARFTRFFLETCLDQVKFMKGLVQPDRLGHRIRMWSEEEIRAGTLPAKADKVLEAVLYKGQLNRGEVPDILGVGARQARRVISSLIEWGVLTSKSTRTPLYLAFPARLVPRWMPGLFPEP